jgi:hypothetical protein
VEALERRDPLSFSQRERARLLAELITYQRTQLTEIASEAERLHALLVEKGMASYAEIAAHHVNAINAEARAVVSAIEPARLSSNECAETCAEAGMERLSRDVLEVVAPSQAALTRATRWLTALGELVFVAFEMRVELASIEATNERSEAED